MFTVGSSTVHAIGMSCNVMLFYDQQGKLRTVPRYSFVRSYPPYQSKIIRMLPTHSTTLCEGDGAIFAEHERASQRLWLSSAGTKAKTATSAGDIITENLNDGNAVLNPAQEVIEALEKLEDVVDAAPANSLSRALDEAEKEFNRGLEAYNNVAFLILSVAAVLSSTAVASISIGSDCDRVAIVMVEAAVIYSFLAIVTHACVVFLRDDTFLIDARDVGVGNFTSSAGIVEVYSETIFLAVGGRTRAPKFLIVTEVFAAIAAVVVSLSVIQSVRWVRRSGRRELVADDVMRDEEDELFSEYSEKEL